MAADQKKSKMTELKEHVMPDIAIDDATPTCRVVGAGTEVSGKQGHLYTPGISAQSVGARRIHLQIVRFPADGPMRISTTATKLPSIS